MSEAFVDGGHDHGGHMHAGGDGAAIGHTPGHHGHHHQGFLGQLFGDGHDHGGHHGSHGGHHHHHTGEFSSNPQGSASWTSALSGIKLSEALKGISVTPNMMLLFMFLSFTAWLGVVYWVRHNEPFVNQVVGTHVHAPTGHADRHLVNGVRHALPIRTTPQSGMIYVPGVPEVAPPAAVPVPAAALASPVAPEVAPVPGGAPLPVLGHVAPTVTPVVPPAAMRGAYHVPIHTADGVRLKTVVNR